jgi:dihydrodipicolinate synthase/N-acetylneuraminate lyase
VLSTELAPFIHAFGIGDEIATTKALFAEVGIFDSGELMAPLQPVAPERAQQLRQAWELGRDAAQARLANGITA